MGVVDTIKKGKCVGELALLYNAPRAASVKETEDSVLWGAFKKALMDTHKRASWIGCKCLMKKKV